jgi:thiamine-monophosphate kinase
MIGRKALARTLSDIAAMGGTPLYALVDLVAPADLPVPFAIGLFRGMRTLALKHTVGIIGGDTAEGPALELHLTAVGTVPRHRAILRSGARPGDILYVTGRLGGSWRPWSKKHYTFQPRLAEGRFLLSWATSMMDLSDGLSTDLPRLLDASHAGASLDFDAIPLSPSALRTPDPLTSALTDGEDFELLFTIPPRKQRAFETSWHRAFPRLPATPIGHILPDPCLRPIPPGGWQHFHS